MCGIVGVVGCEQAVPLLIEGLSRLEYRGYDSAGVATLVDGVIERRRQQGKLEGLRGKLQSEPLSGRVGIGHTRWATHGRPNETNAHPHATDEVAVVHNGIIENHRALRLELEAQGCVFSSETDTEVVAHLVSHELRQGKTPAQAVAASLKRLEGAFALGMIFAGHEDLLIAARRGSPLAVGVGPGQQVAIGSDALALAPISDNVIYLEEGDWAQLTPGHVEIYDSHDAPAHRAMQPGQLSGAMTGKGSYRHFMSKEIAEQPVVIGNTLCSLLDEAQRKVATPGIAIDWDKITRLTVTACGTAYYAGLVAKYWFERLAGMPVEVDIASEYRYRGGPVDPAGLCVVISQSGETADTLAALRHVRQKGQKVLAVVNVPHSSIAREADYVIPTLAGPEIGVASTKAFTTQLAVLACLAIQAGVARGALTPDAAADLVQALTEVPAQINEILHREAQLQHMAKEFVDARHALYLGRGSTFPLALEGALKLKEISYIHAEGYPSGELKHGPIALIDDSMPVIVLAPHDELFEKTVSNLQEVRARGGRSYVFSDAAGLSHIDTTAGFEMPTCHPLTAPILYAIPMQLLAYHTAIAKGTDVDQPRNLAKSVTVE
ncbi:MAG: glutamine--fructose-6-phosphate transaminase (isomerizing) [Alphaproteobacteria bacterium]|nr:MAG: glutamine--fructose-6-phosphate transaminase (isomerizing) [Alphaproteobacteria bacterium]